MYRIDKIKKINRAVFELETPKPVIKGVFKSSHCCYGNLLGRENDNNVFTNDWAVIWLHDCSIKW